MAGPERPPPRPTYRRLVAGTAVLVAALWTLCGVVVATDLVVDWADDVCTDSGAPCSPDARASLESARATDRLTRTVVGGAVAAVTVAAGLTVDRVRRRARDAAESARRHADRELEWHRSDFADAAWQLGDADPVGASSLLARLERGTDTDPTLAADLGRIVSVAIRHWDRLRRAETDPLAARERREAVEEAVAFLARRAERVPVDLSGVDLDGLRLSGGDQLAGAVLHDTELTECGLAGVDLSGADLSGATLTGADLEGTDLHGATLRGAHVDVACLRSADLMAVDAGGADFDRSDLSGADMSLAKCLATSFLRSRLRACRLVRADLTRARLHRADLRGTDLSGATLTETDLRHACLAGADLSEALLNGADLTGADLRGADLTSADLGGAWLEGVLHDEATRWPAHVPPSVAYGRRQTTGPLSPPNAAPPDGPGAPNPFWDAPRHRGWGVEPSAPEIVGLSGSGDDEPDIAGEARVGTDETVGEGAQRQHRAAPGLDGGDRTGDDRPGVLRE